MTCVVASLMVSHWVPLPHPENGVALVGHETLDSSFDGKSASWSAVHFLYADCPCSRRILDHVVARSPLTGVREHIVLIGEQDPKTKEARAAGYEVTFVTPSELKQRFGIESAPLLIVTDVNGIIRYGGGYTSRKQGPDIQDESLIRAAVDGRWQETLPLYGCAVSKQLKDLVDPLRLK
jgi:hypothetical protein